MTDPIKAALVAATRAYCFQDGECPCAKPEACAMCVVEIKPCIAAAIAAFLRAMPAIEVDLQTGGTVGFWSRRVALFAAAAVEKAARHD